MRSVKNSDRLQEILVTTRHQIVSLKDIQMDLLARDAKVANQVATQITALEEVYKHQHSLVELAKQLEPQKTGWLSGQVKTEKDRMSAIMD